MIATALAGEAAWAKERAPQLRETTATRLASLDRTLSDRMFLLGSEFSGADVLMGHVLGFIVDATLLDAAPHVKAYNARLKSRPAYTRALAAQAGGKNAAVAAR
jgi:glutathione S-transferase